jgi:hypothetical protein
MNAPIFTRGDRVRDRVTGKLGTHDGIAHLGSRIVTLVHWDEAENATPLHPHQTIEHVEEETR